MALDTATRSRLCSICALQAGLEAGGSAYSYAHVLAVETPLPWPLSMYSEPGVLPEELLELRRRLVDAYTRGETLQLGALAIAPDPAYSVPGMRRVISYRRPETPFASFQQAEYLVPEADLGPLCWALLFEPETLPRFAAGLQPPNGARDLMICTHGSVDAACAKFGFPLYRKLRQLAEQQPNLRIWRVSHFGGHVFAPTMIDMPEFRYWAYVEDELAEQIASRSGETLRLHPNCRGWAGFDSPLLQVAERELFVRHGWEWTHFAKTGRVLAQEPATDTPTWATVQVQYAAPDGRSGSYEARVELARRVACIASTGDKEPTSYPQYYVTQLHALSSKENTL